LSTWSSTRYFGFCSEPFISWWWADCNSIPSDACKTSCFYSIEDCCQLSGPGTLILHLNLTLIPGTICKMEPRKLQLEILSAQNLKNVNTFGYKEDEPICSCLGFPPISKSPQQLTPRVVWILLGIHCAYWLFRSGFYSNKMQTSK